jgi:hypothetical protein
MRGKNTARLHTKLVCLGHWALWVGCPKRLVRNKKLPTDKPQNKPQKRHLLPHHLPLLLQSKKRRLPLHLPLHLPHLHQPVLR